MEDMPVSYRKPLNEEAREEISSTTRRWKQIGAWTAIFLGLLPAGLVGFLTFIFTTVISDAPGYAEYLRIAAIAASSIITVVFVFLIAIFITVNWLIEKFHTEYCDCGCPCREKIVKIVKGTPLRWI